ncbi:MAG: hypothetical protein ABIW85_11435 [Variovorax sp.]
MARLVGLDLMRPVASPGGEAAIQIEARRLGQLACAGLRVPMVLAQTDTALLLSDLSSCTTTRADDQASDSPSCPDVDGIDPAAGLTLERALDEARGKDLQSLLPLWQRGLTAITDLHARGQFLSQAFARNMVCCPDGVIGFLDFEDDPAESLPFAHCQARDWLSYAHSTAARIESVSPDAAIAAWRAALDQGQEAVRSSLRQAAQRMGWLAHLPAGRRWGRDTQQVRAAARLLVQWRRDRE